MCLIVLLVCVSACHLFSWCPSGSEELLDSQGLELQTIVSQHINSGSQTQILHKSNKCSKLLSHPSVTLLNTYKMAVGYLCLFF